MTKTSKDGVTIEITRETIRDRMYYVPISNSMIKFCVELADELEIDSAIVNDSLATFNIVSVRAKIIEGELDFNFALHNDTPQQIRDKFKGYLDSQYADLLDDVIEAITAMDRVQDETLAPVPLSVDADKKK